MRYSVICLLVLFFMTPGCASVEPLPYEGEDLMVIQHNDYNNYILMVYRDALGQTKHVLRRNGMTEIVLTYTIEGTIELKARGKKLKEIEAIEAGHITQRINSLLKAESYEKAGIASI